MEVVWKFRHRSYRAFVDGLLILPPSVYLTQQGEDSPSLVLLHLNNEGRILLTSHSSKAIDEILTLLLTPDFEESNGIKVERTDVEKKSPIISTLEEKNWHFSKENLLSSVDLAHLLADSSNFKLGSASPTPLPEDFTVVQKVG
jgi:hypothetical protein